MTYHLTAYAPWEGYRVMFNGSRGRLELEVVESDHVSPAAAGAMKGPAARGRGGHRARFGTGAVRPFWAPPYEVTVPGTAATGTAVPTRG